MGLLVWVDRMLFAVAGRLVAVWSWLSGRSNFALGRLLLVGYVGPRAWVWAGVSAWEGVLLAGSYGLVVVSFLVHVRILEREAALRVRGVAALPLGRYGAIHAWLRVGWVGWTVLQVVVAGSSREAWGLGVSGVGFVLALTVVWVFDAGGKGVVGRVRAALAARRPVRRVVPVPSPG